MKIDVRKLKTDVRVRFVVLVGTVVVTIPLWLKAKFFGTLYMKYYGEIQAYNSGKLSLTVAQLTSIQNKLNQVNSYQTFWGYLFMLMAVILVVSLVWAVFPLLPSGTESKGGTNE